MRKFIRNAAFRFARHDLLQFIQQHENELLEIFREEMHKFDQRLPEEKALIDINMVGLGDEMMRAVLSTLKRFLGGEPEKEPKTAGALPAASDDEND
ncbi:hypothetical protein GF406_13235 [candidate division KSB1 bacterium]|nr:hypothetical protein [candidate division KSB1 bacterium]